MNLSALEFLKQGGIFISAIGIVGFFVCLITIERFIALYFKMRIDAQALFSKIEETFRRGDTDAAQQIAIQAGRKPAAQLIASALQRWNATEKEIELAIETEKAYQTPRILSRLNFLSTFANISTLLGLVGTVLGLIRSFSALGGNFAAGLTKGQALASGVAESMYTTAGGLIIAIPALLFHLILSSKANQILDELDLIGLELKNLLLSPQQSARQSSLIHATNAVTPIADQSAATRETLNDLIKDDSVPGSEKITRPIRVSKLAAEKLAAAFQQVTKERDLDEKTEFLDQPLLTATALNSKTEIIANPLHQTEAAVVVAEAVVEEIRRLSQIKANDSTKKAAAPTDEITENQITIRGERT